jgi:hypothetical protein
MNWSGLFPPAEKYTGPRVPFYFLILIAIVSTVRSLIHMFVPDGGAEIIAGINLSVEGGANIVAMFGQWGASQLLLALIYWLVILRYRSLTSLMLAVIVVEQLLRIGIGHLKPLVVATPPPGAIGSELILPLGLIALIWSLWPNKKR